MKVFAELLTTPSGLLVLGVIVFIILMGIYLALFVRRKIAEETAGK